MTETPRSPEDRPYVWLSELIYDESQMEDFISSYEDFRRWLRRKRRSRSWKAYSPSNREEGGE